MILDINFQYAKSQTAQEQEEFLQEIIKNLNDRAEGDPSAPFLFKHYVIYTDIAHLLPDIGA